MKRSSRVLTLLLALLMLTGLFCTALAADVSTMTVHLRIEGVEGSLFSSDITFDYVGETPTVSGFLNAVAGTAGLPEIVMESSDYGAYISAIDGVTEGTYGGWDGWMFRINSLSPMEGISFCTLADGDDVVIYYSDEYGVGMQYPYVDAGSLAADGTVRVLSDDVVYDADWNALLVTNPVAGAVLVFDGQEYITDETGAAVIRQQDRGLGVHTVAVERYAENGCPTVLRLAPDATVTFGFADISENFPYREAVDFVLRHGLMNGTDAQHFSPTLYLNRATFVTVLWRAAGCPELPAGPDGTEAAAPVFSDVPEDKWYTTAVAWAASCGITLGYEDGTFRPMESLTGQQAYVMLWRAAGSPAAEADLSVYEDAGSVSAYALDAMRWAAANGYTDGTSRLSPVSRISRAKTADLLMRTLSALA